MSCWLPLAPAAITALIAWSSARVRALTATNDQWSFARPPSARVQAIAILLDRGRGKAPQTHTGEDGEGDIRVTIRHIVEGSNGAAQRVPGEQRALVQIDAAKNNGEP
jgi:hypothetical protein